MLAVSTGAANPRLSGALPEKDAADWRSDLRFLESEIARVHPNPYHAVSRAKLHAAFEKLEARLPKLDPRITARGFLPRSRWSSPRVTLSTIATRFSRRSS
jgi:hypothetical protein